MAKTLTGKTIEDSYLNVLTVGNDNTEATINTTPKPLLDGAGTPSTLLLASNRTQVTSVPTEYGDVMRLGDFVHNKSTDKQGGFNNEFYHLSKSQYDWVIANAGFFNPPTISNLVAIPTSYPNTAPANVALSASIIPNEGTSISWQVIGTNGYDSGVLFGNTIALTDTTMSIVIGTIFYSLTVNYLDNNLIQQTVIRTAQVQVTDAFLAPTVASLVATPTAYSSGNPRDVILTSSIVTNGVSGITWNITGTNGYTSGPQVGNTISLTDTTKSTTVGTITYTLTVNYSDLNGPQQILKTDQVLVVAGSFVPPTITNFIATPDTYTTTTAVDVLLTATLTANDGVLTNWVITGTNGYNSGTQTTPTVNITDPTKIAVADTYVYTLTLNYTGGGSGVTTSTTNLVVSVTPITENAKVGYSPNGATLATVLSELNDPANTGIMPTQQFENKTVAQLQSLFTITPNASYQYHVICVPVSFGLTKIYDAASNDITSAFSKAANQTVDGAICNVYIAYVSGALPTQYRVL